MEMSTTKNWLMFSTTKNVTESTHVYISSLCSLWICIYLSFSSMFNHLIFIWLWNVECTNAACPRVPHVYVFVTKKYLKKMWRKKKKGRRRSTTTDHARRQHVVQVLQESLIFNLIISEDEGNSVPITTCCAVQVPEVIQQIGHIVRPAGEQGCKSKVKVNSCVWVNWEVWVGGQGWGNAQPVNIQNRTTQLL